MHEGQHQTKAQLLAKVAQAQELVSHPYFGLVSPQLHQRAGAVQCARDSSLDVLNLMVACNYDGWPRGSSMRRLLIRLSDFD
jgi:hypothetical protein